MTGSEVGSGPELDGLSARGFIALAPRAIPAGRRGFKYPDESGSCLDLAPVVLRGSFAGCRLVVVEVREGEKIEMPLGQLSMLSLPFVSPLESGENPPQGFDVYVSLALRQR